MTAEVTGRSGAASERPRGSTGGAAPASSNRADQLAPVPPLPVRSQRASPVEPAADVDDDDTWWDRHGWDLGDTDAAVDDVPVDDDDPAVETAGADLSWSRLANAVAVVGTLVTLPLLGLTGGYGRILAPVAWTFLGLGVSLALSGREPAWDLREPRRAEPVGVWAVLYAAVVVVGLNAAPLTGNWVYWLPATAGAALVPLVVARFRWAEERAALHPDDVHPDDGHPDVRSGDVHPREVAAGQRGLASGADRAGGDTVLADGTGIRVRPGGGRRAGS